MKDEIVGKLMEKRQEKLKMNFRNESRKIPPKTAKNRKAPLID